MNSTLTDTLTVLAQSIESLQSAGAPPGWAEITGRLDEPEQVRWHVDPQSLVGFVAPADCAAIVTVGHGWAHGLPDDGRDDSRRLLAPGERRRVRAVCIMTRQGDVNGYVREGTKLLVNEPPTVGRILDCMRRSFGLPTPPPEEPTDAFLAFLWLSNVGRAGELAPLPLAWADVTRLHPALQVAEQGGIVVPANQLISILRMAADTWSWSYLAHEAASPGWLSDLLPEGAGGWMDEGILARWLLASFSDVDRLLEKVTPRLTPPAAKRLRRTLLELGVLPRPRR